MIRNAAELTGHIKAAVMEHGATPSTDVLVRVGPDGPLMRITCMKGLRDARGFALVMEVSPVLMV